jgi:hypothetical protein
MEHTNTGELVTIATEGPDLDGVVFDRPSSTKVVVAVMDRNRGPVFRTVHPKALSERTAEGPDDRALHLLIRRTPITTKGAARGGAGIGHGRAGHTRAAMHRTTGK